MGVHSKLIDEWWHLKNFSTFFQRIEIIQKIFNIKILKLTLLYDFFVFFFLAIAFQTMFKTIKIWIYIIVTYS